MDLHVLRSPESENHIFSVWSVCMCVSVCTCACYQQNSKTNYSRNIKFGILHLYYTQMLLETFHKDRPFYFLSLHTFHSKFIHFRPKLTSKLPKSFALFHGNSKTDLSGVKNKNFPIFLLGKIVLTFLINLFIFVI